MTMCKWFAGGLLAVALMLGTAANTRAAEGDPAQPGKAAAKAAKPDGEKQPALKGYYAIMASQLGLTDEQKAKVAEIAKARADADAAWQKESGEKVAAAKKALADAKDQGDQAAAAKAKADFAALTDAQAKLDQDWRGEILAVLTPEQREQWAGFNLYVGSVAAKFKKAELTDEQVKQIKALCTAAAKEIAPLNGGDKQGAGQIFQIKEKLNQQIRDQVLTADQRATLDAAAKAPKKGDAAAPMAPAVPGAGADQPKPKTGAAK
jgi:Spy/CpxP family protein refolding chaperone